MKYGLEDRIIEQICAVFADFPAIDKVILYGSRAKGNYKNGSDIDLCFFGKDLTKDIIYKIDLVLDDLLLPYSFDLSIYKDLENQELKEHINRIGTVFYSP